MLMDDDENVLRYMVEATLPLQSLLRRKRLGHRSGPKLLEEHRALCQEGAAHNLNNTIAVRALIYVKTPQMALFRVTEVTANVVTFKLWLVSGVADHADRAAVSAGKM